MEKDELSRDPCPRKQAGDRTIYTSQIFCQVVGSLYLCDLGNALVGDDNVRPAMPMQYRAPEIILGMEWGHPIDMWSVGVMVSLARVRGQRVNLIVSAGMGYDAAYGLISDLRHGGRFTERCTSSCCNDRASWSAIARVSRPEPGVVKVLGRKWSASSPLMEVLAAN